VSVLGDKFVVEGANTQVSFVDWHKSINIGEEAAKEAEYVEGQ
jgi:hypothetical protein